MEKRCYGCMKLKTKNPVCEHCGYDERMGNASHQLPVGTMLMGRYRIGKVLGQGGFGITYIGWDTFLETAVAVKEYYPSGVVMRDNSYSLNVSSGGGEMDARFQNNRERFLREAKALARFDSVPQVVQVSNYFLDNNTAYIVMEFVEGITLKQHVKKNGGKLSAEQTLALLGPVMLALDKVHATGLIHRDISPDNIMLLPNGGVKLIDFGAVRDVQHADAENPLTKSTEAILKQGYAPIEQYQKRGSLGPWTDVYALCATIYYCLMGQVPPDAPERLMGEAEFSWDGVPGLEDHQREALEHAMAQLPKDRTQSVKTLHKELFEEPAPKPDPKPQPKPAAKPVPKPAPKAPKKKVSFWKTAAMGLAAIALVLGGMLLSTFLSSNTNPESGAQSGGIFTPAKAKYLENVMMYGGSDTNYVPGSQIPRMDILSIHFLDTLKDMPEDAWDMSMEENGSVMAWAVVDGDYYHLYIAGDGGVSAPRNSKKLFCNYKSATEIEFGEAFHTDGVTSMNRMFKNCHAVTDLDLSGFVTSEVGDMAGMFMGCFAMETVDVSSFDTANVYDMGMMFACGQEEVAEEQRWNSGTSKLKKLDLSHFDTLNVERMMGMFSDCTSLEVLDVSNFSLKSAKYISNMFGLCKSLKVLDISSFDFQNVESNTQMFYETPLETLYVSDSFLGLNRAELELTGSCQVIQGSVSDGEALLPEETQPVYEEPENTLMSNPLAGELRVQSYSNYYSVSEGPDIAAGEMAFRTDKRKRMISEITFLSSLKTAPEDAWDVSQAENGKVLAWTKPKGNYFCHLYIAAEGGVLAPANSKGLFAGFTELEAIHFNGAFHTENAVDMSWMFYRCDHLVELNVSSFDTVNVTDMSHMFRNCERLERLNVQNFDTSNVTNMSGMFFIGVQKWSEEWSVRGFPLDVQRQTINVSHFDTSKVTDMSEMFYLSGVKQLDLRNFDTANVTNMARMFGFCMNMTKVDLSNFNTSKVANMKGIFVECNSLTKLDLSSFDPDTVDMVAEGDPTWDGISRDITWPE